MNKYGELLKYIGCFEDDNSIFCTWKQPSHREEGVITLGYPIYDDSLKQFIDDVSKTDLMKRDYLEYIERHIPNQQKMVENIETANLELLQAILTYFVRGERFCDGLWGQAAKDKMFLNILYRLKNIIDKIDYER